MKAKALPQLHPIPPLFDEHSTVLILGSFPSVKSREAMFFYGHPRNRFWQIMAALTDRPTPQTVAEKTDLILSHRLALWDSIGSCSIAASSDSSIRDVVPNDLSVILNHAPISRIYCNGATSLKYFQRYNSDLPIAAQVLPSTSPANAAWSTERLIEAWRVIFR